MATIPTRIDSELFEAAKHVGEEQRRSAAQQLDYWARLGRELDASRSITHHQITAVLRGEARYDDLDPTAQALVRSEWEHQLAGDAAGIDLTEALPAATAWTEADELGRPVRHTAG